MALQNFNISFDLYGTLYLSNDKNTYQVNIDGKNNVTLDKGDYPVIDGSTNIYKIAHLDENSLKTKIRNVNQNNEEHIDEEDEIERNDYTYYPEDSDHLHIDDPDLIQQEYINEDIINQYGEHNIPFVFWEPDGSEFTQIKITNRQDCDIMALYDTYIYDVNNRLIFKSHSSDDSSIYIIRIYPIGELYFRPIGNTERKYILNTNEIGELKIT